MVLDSLGNPIARRGDEVNPYLWDEVDKAIDFMKEELKNQDCVFIAEVRILQKMCNGK